MGVILDTNIYLRATALHMGEAQGAGDSRHDRDSSPAMVSHSGMTPRQCRALIMAQLRKPNGVYMPKRQAAEIEGAIDNLRRLHSTNPNNERLLACIEQFAANASIGNHAPFLRAQVDQQYEVLKRALTIAQHTANFVDSPSRRAAQRFITKHENFLSRALPEPNHALLMAARAPFIWNDFFLAYAAKRAGTVVVTMDRDFEFIAEAFKEVTGYNPARMVSYFPDERDHNSFRQVVTEHAKPAGPAAPDI